MSENSEHYQSGYLNKERWFSYVYQLQLLSDIDPQSVLEIGVGPGVVCSMVEAAHPGCSYTSVDMDYDLQPAVCADVRSLPFKDGAFDVLFCCQVLEHLPFECFYQSLVELKRVVTKRVVVSLPDVRPHFFLRFTHSRRLAPLLWNGFSIPLPLTKVHSFDEHGQHYWEIGKRGFPLKLIRTEIEKAGFTKFSHFRMTERSYWHFFVMDVA